MELKGIPPLPPAPRSCKNQNPLHGVESLYHVWICEAQLRIHYMELKGPPQGVERRGERARIHYMELKERTARPSP